MKATCGHIGLTVNASPCCEIASRLRETIEHLRREVIAALECCAELERRLDIARAGEQDMMELAASLTAELEELTGRRP